MERTVFQQRFLEPAAVARDFTRGYIEERLPDAMRFRVHLHWSLSLHGPAFRDDILIAHGTDVMTEPARDCNEITRTS